MQNHLPHFHPAGSAHHIHQVHFAHAHHLIHHQHPIAAAQHLPHPFHWAHSAGQHLHDRHPLQHIHEKHYAAHTGSWISAHAALIAVLAAGLLCCILYIILSTRPINDYTTGSWSLFG